MDTFIEALVLVVQLALAGFLVWGGWLCVSDRVRAARLPRIGDQMRVVEERKAQHFEWVASLVLLALLFSAAAGL